MKPNKYETLVKKLFTSLVEQVDGLSPRAVGYGKQNYESGKSGYKHQIDVSVRTETEIHLIECKLWRKKVDPEALLCMAARVIDIGKANPGCVIKGALATTQGCT